MRARQLPLLAFAALSIAVAAACSGSGGGGGGGGTPTPTGNVVKVVGSDGQPIPAVTVVVNDSAGNVAGTAQTGADGTAALDVPPGGSFTVLDIADGAYESQTVIRPPAGIAPITIVAATTPIPSPTAPPPTTTIQATFQGGAGVSSVAWFANCESFPIVTGYSAGVMSQQTAPACAGQTGWDLLAIGKDGGGTPVAWAEQLGQPDDFGQTLSVTLDMQDTSFDTVSVGHAALPSPGDANASLLWSSGTAGPLTLTAIPYVPALPKTASAVSASAMIPHGIASGASPAVYVTMTNGNGTSTSLTEEWKVAGTPAASYTLDPASHALVQVGFLDVTDPARLVLNWTPSAGTRGAAGTITIVWTTAADAGVRRVIFPSDMDPSFTVPALPASAASWQPTASSYYLRWSAGYDDVDALATYGAWLTTDRSTLASYDHFVSLGTLP